MSKKKRIIPYDIWKGLDLSWCERKTTVIPICIVTNNQDKPIEFTMESEEINE